MDTQIALSLNMQAVLSHNENDYNTAIKRYRGAMEQLNKSIYTKNRVEHDWVYPQVRLVVQPSCPAFLTEMTQTGEVIVSSPFCVTTSAPDHTLFQISDEDSHLLCLALMFNLALSYHLRAVSDIKHRSLYLRRAMSLYKTAMKIVVDNEGFFREVSGSFLVVAVGNNLCAILAEFHEYEKLRKIMEFTTYYWQLSEGSARFFPLNTMSWNLAHAQPAPCA